MGIVKDHFLISASSKHPTQTITMQNFKVNSSVLIYAMLLVSSISATPLFLPAAAGGAALTGAAVGGAALTAEGLALAGAGAAFIPTSVLIIKAATAAALAKAGLIVGVASAAGAARQAEQRPRQAPRRRTFRTRT